MALITTYAIVRAITRQSRIRVWYNGHSLRPLRILCALCGQKLLTAETVKKNREARENKIFRGTYFRPPQFGFQAGNRIECCLY